MQHIEIKENKVEYNQLNEEDKGLPQDELNRIRASVSRRCPTKAECIEVGSQLISKGSVGFAISKGIMSIINKDISCSTHQNQQTEVITTSVCVSALILVGLYSSKKTIKEHRMKRAKEELLHLNAESARKNAIEMIEQSKRHHEEQKAMIERQHQELLENERKRTVVYIADLQDTHLRSFEERDLERAKNKRLLEEENPERTTHSIDFSMPDIVENSSYRLSCC